MNKRRGVGENALFELEAVTTSTPARGGINDKKKSRFHLDWPVRKPRGHLSKPAAVQTVGLLQFAPQQRDAVGNVSFICDSLTRTTNAIIVLPEFFLSSYSSYEDSILGRAQLATILAPLQKLAERNRLSLVGSLPVRKADRSANSVVIIHRGTTRFTPQDKQRLFGREEDDFTSGSHRNRTTIGDVATSVQICMDIVDPIPVREAVAEGARLVLAPSTVSVDFLRTIHKARSLENQAVNVFCNRIGKDVDGTIYLGRSALFFPDGAELPASSRDEELITADVDMSQVVGFKAKFGM